jgi:tetrapyrrole methylase family protein / MazG family protein
LTEVGPSPPTGGARPRVVVVGLGPAGAGLVPEGAVRALAGAARAYVRTRRHPAVDEVERVVAADRPAGGLESFDRLYDGAGTIDEVYGAIVEELVSAAMALATAAAGGRDGRGPAGTPYVAYAVPGSPYVAERTVVMLRGDDRVTVEVMAAPSFVDLAWDRLGVDPVAAGVRLVDGAGFAVEAAGERGPLLVAQCHSRAVLSAIKLAGDDAAGEDEKRTAVLLHHLGLDDELVLEVAWADLDRTIEPDHLTAVWIEELAAPVAVELARLDELVHRLRAECPWDQKQTHGSLAGHLLEETYETLDAIEAVASNGPEVGPAAVEHLEEELGDLLFQVYFHAVLAAEEGWFTLADVARGVHEKLVARHPHVFSDTVAATAEAVAANWEVLKKKEKGRSSVTEGIPTALPALALAAKLQKRATSVGLEGPGLSARRAEVAGLLEGLEPGGDGDELGRALGQVLFAVAEMARTVGVDPETALRARTGEFRREIEARESGSDRA